MSLVIETNQRSKVFGDMRAVDAIGSSRSIGEIFSFLEPNGGGVCDPVRYAGASSAVYRALLMREKW